MKYLPNIRCKKCKHVCTEFDLEVEHEPGMTGRAADDDAVYICPKCNARHYSVEDGWDVV